jgi:hypothetical protein
LPGDPIAEDDRLWRQYLVLVELYKFYLEIALKAAVWYFATAGTILTYFFRHIAGPDARPLLFVLLFLSFASLGFGYLHFRGAHHMHEVLPWLEYIASSLRIPGRPHVEFIAAFLLIDSISTSRLPPLVWHCLLCSLRASSSNGPARFEIDQTLNSVSLVASPVTASARLRSFEIGTEDPRRGRRQRQPIPEVVRH